MRILMTGATGFLGTELAEELVRRGHVLVVATRNPRIYPHFLLSYPARLVKWPLDPKELATVLSSIDACIHLAGEPIAAKRWSAEQKAKIYETRVMGTRELVSHLTKAPNLKVFLSASGIGYYGNCKDEAVTEAEGHGADFLAEVCRDWEDEAQSLQRKDVRVCQLRTGAVLGRNQGFLAELEPLFRVGLAGTLGSGRQYISWIHIKDWVRACVFALENSEVSGGINLTAPEPVTNHSFTRVMGKRFQQKMFLPTPGFAVRIAMGELATLALKGQKVLPKKLQDAGFQFRFSNLTDALNDLYSDPPYSVPKHRLVFRQWLPAPIQNVFAYVTDGANLPTLMPQKLRTQWQGQNTEKPQQGSLLKWQLRWKGIPIGWQSQISEWRPVSEVASEMVQGPFRSFHHRMHFERVRDGVILTDTLEYELPLRTIGEIFAAKKVVCDLKSVFEFRGKRLAEIFQKEHPSNPSGEREGSRSS